MKILFLNSNIGYGGASKMLTWVANQFAEKGHSVTFITYRDSAICQLLDNRVNQIHVSFNDTGGGKNIFKTVFYLHKYIKLSSPDLGIAFLPPSILRLSLASIGTNIKILYSERGDPYQFKQIKGLKNHLLKILEHWAFSRANGFVFQTEKAKSYYSNKIQSKSVIIPNPINPLQRTMKRTEGGNKHIVCIARLDIHQKRQDVLINAFKKISKQIPNYTLDLYGDGDDLKPLQDLARDCSRIRFMGKTSNVIEALQNSTISVLSSDFEGIPNSILESMSLGVPTISTDCSPGGAAMLIQTGVNGILVPCHNVDALANAILLLVHNPKYAEELGHNGMSVNRKFDSQNIANKWYSFINSFN